MGLVWDTVIPDRKIAVGKNGVFMYFASREIIAKVISDLHNILWKLVTVLPVLWSPLHILGYLGSKDDSLVPFSCVHFYSSYWNSEEWFQFQFYSQRRTPVIQNAICLLHSTGNPGCWAY